MLRCRVLSVQFVQFVEVPSRCVLSSEAFLLLLLCRLMHGGCLFSTESSAMHKYLPIAPFYLKKI